MTGPPADPYRNRDDSNDDRIPATAEDTTPRWVKVFGVIAVIILLVVVVVHLAGGGFHGHASP